MVSRVIGDQAMRRRETQQESQFVRTHSLEGQKLGLSALSLQSIDNYRAGQLDLGRLRHELGVQEFQALVDYRGDTVELQQLSQQLRRDISTESLGVEYEKLGLRRDAQDALNSYNQGKLTLDQIKTVLTRDEMQNVMTRHTDNLALKEQRLKLEEDLAYDKLLQKQQELISDSAYRTELNKIRREGLSVDRLKTEMAGSDDYAKLQKSAADMETKLGDFEGGFQEGRIDPTMTGVARYINEVGDNEYGYFAEHDLDDPSKSKMYKVYFPNTKSRGQLRYSDVEELAQSLSTIRGRRVTVQEVAKEQGWLKAE